MTTADPLPGRLFQTNVRRYYLYVFLHNFQLWFSIWVLYLQRERGLSLTQVTLLDVLFWLVIVLSPRFDRLSPTVGAQDIARARSGRPYTAAILAVRRRDQFLGAAGVVPHLGRVASTLQLGADTALLYESLSADGRGEDFLATLGRAQAVAIVAGLLGSPSARPWRRQ
ncbi:MAG: hypothetical protein U0531_13440 [Dehalococcoidia bacterium]